MKQPLTERQNDALEYIRSYLRAHSKPPTLQEIGDALGIRSTNGVYKLLKALERKGHIEREPNAARGLTLTDADDAFALDDRTPSLMLISRTASDQPELLRRRPNNFLTVDPYLLRGVADVEACLLARAGDDGMNRDGIRKGDLLVIEEAAWNDLRKGELVAVLIKEELRARRFEFTNNRIHLRSSDRTYTDETFSPQDPGCYVIGRVVALMRKL